MQGTAAPVLSLPRLSRRWMYPEPVPGGAVNGLEVELKLPRSLCRLLVQRGYGTAEAARDFLRPHPGQLHPPGTLAGIGEAVERISKAIAGGETILVHGDYDVDGICATALYVRALRRFGGKVEAFVPHRLSDGYDLSEAGVRAAVEAGAGLILTGDCGIVAHSAVEEARRRGIDVIVTDHHTPGPTLPAAAAVVNPNRVDCGYPDKGLAGVGVAYKVMCATAEAMGHDPDQLSCFLDLVAVATIADLAPLTAENRAMVRWGLKVLARTPNPGLQALLRSTRLGEKAEITAGQVGFVLAPRINAVGRMSEALVGVRLLLTDDADEARAIAASLEEENRWRRQVDGETLREAITLLEREYDPARDFGVVLAKRGWHPGVIGIVASRVVELIHRPAVLIALDEEGEGKGSARSVPGFHLYEAMRDCAGHLTRFGGHRAAAGCSLRADRVDAFREAFNARAAAALSPELLIPETRIDLEVTLDEADDRMCRLLRHAAPFGMGNPTPVLGARGVTIAGRPRVVGTDHLKLTLHGGGTRLEAIGFGMGGLAEKVSAAGAAWDVAFKLEENSWSDRSGVERTTLQARLVDLRPAE
jgi:single-stranded-DNA-specific exonuclease